VVLDEAAMTADAELLQVLSTASRTGAKVVLVGHHRQLGAVGPGGGFESLVTRYGAAVHVLVENVRQHDVADRAALAELRDGDVAKAVASYAVAAASSPHQTAHAPSRPWWPAGPPMWPRPTRR
jgi:ATP-dependent exoDNAse (exonuclease V) alpha subunit